MNRCGSFPLLSAPHSLFSIWTNLERSEKIPGAPTRRWGEWIWLTGPSGLHRNSPQGLNISSIRVSDQIRDPDIPITLRPLNKYIILYKYFTLRGAMGRILVKNHFFILLNKFKLHTLIYDSLKFQISITIAQSFIRPYVDFCAI